MDPETTAPEGADPPPSSEERQPTHPAQHEEVVESAPDAVEEPASAEPSGDGPSPFESVPAALQPALQRRGFTELSEVQAAVLAADSGASDLRISSQTGSGKTVALGLVVSRVLVEPRGDRGPDVLVVVPTRELAQQVSTELRWLFADLEDTTVASVTGGTPIFQDKNTLRNEPRVLIGTPGRLVDHLNNENLDLGNARELVLDEAD
ncbi:MAG: DEAD/DEAH box helicase family protein, partial [Planctomycetota bacterium]